MFINPNRNHNHAPTPKQILTTILLLLYILAATALIATDLKIHKQLKRLSAELEIVNTIATSQQQQLEAARKQLESARTYIEARQWICPECGAINQRSN